MPAKSPLFLLGCAWLPVALPAQITYIPWTLVSASQAAMPSEGPAAARINPAELAEVHLVSLTYGHAGSLSGSDETEFLQLAAGSPSDRSGWPVHLAAGFGYMLHGRQPQHTNAVYQKTEYDPSLAVRFPADPDARWRLGAGLAFDIEEFDAFDVISSTALGIDIGASTSLGFGSAGRFGLGFVYHDLKSPRVRLPDNSDDYKVRGWKEYSLDWSSPARFVRIRLGWYFAEDGDPSEGPNWKGESGLNDWEAELRPLTWFALKAERTHSSDRSNLGAIIYLPKELAHCDVRFELNVGYSRFGAANLPSPFRDILLLDKLHDKGQGWLIGGSLSVGI